MPLYSVGLVHSVQFDPNDLLNLFDLFGPSSEAVPPWIKIRILIHSGEEGAKVIATQANFAVQTFGIISPCPSGSLPSRFGRLGYGVAAEPPLPDRTNFDLL